MGVEEIGRGGIYLTRIPSRASDHSQAGASAATARSPLQPRDTLPRDRASLTHQKLQGLDMPGHAL